MYLATLYMTDDFTGYSLFSYGYLNKISSYRVDSSVRVLRPNPWNRMYDSTYGMDTQYCDFGILIF